MYANATPKRPWYLNKELTAPMRELSLSALPLAFRRRFPFIVRIMWLIIFVAAFTVLALMVKKEIELYLTVQKRVNRMSVMSPVPFPAVTICNINPYKSTEMNKIDELMAVESYFLEAQQLGQPFPVDQNQSEPELNLSNQCPVLSLPDGFVNTANDPLRRLGGKAVPIICNNGHSEPASVNCIFNNITGLAEWDARPICRKSCRPILFRSDASQFCAIVKYENPNMYGGTGASVSCAAGYRTPGGSNAMRTTCVDGKWTPAPDCLRTFCGTLVVWKTRKINDKHSVDDPFILAYKGRNVSLWCDNGFWRSDTAGFLGQAFVENRGKSANVQCPPFVIKNGDYYTRPRNIEGKLDAADELRKGDHVVYWCKKGYQLTHAVYLKETPLDKKYLKSRKTPEFRFNMLTCREVVYKYSRSFQWKGFATKSYKTTVGFCAKKCAKLKLNNPKHMKLVFRPSKNQMTGATVHVSCRNGATLVGPPVLHCLEDGSWSRTRPICINVCEKLEELGNGTINMLNGQLEQPVVGAVAQYRCHKTEWTEFKRNTPYDRLTCMNTGWSQDQPTCKVTCPPIQSLQGKGDVVYQNYKRYEDTQAKLICTAENHILVGDYRVRCRGDGKWDNYRELDPYCKEVPSSLMKMLTDVDLREYQKDAQALLARTEEIRLFMIGGIEPEKIVGIGHRLQNEMLQKCIFDGIPCDGLNDFQQFLDPISGNCFTFNQDKENIRIVQQPGPKYGLQLQLNANQSEYIRTTRQTGIQIIVHKQNQTITSDAYGTHVPMGYHVTIALQYIEIRRLNAPDGSCANDANGLIYYFDKEYSVEGCYHSCKQKKLIEICGCGDPRLPLPKGYSHCGLEKIVCMDQAVVDPTTLKNSCVCPPVCRTITYQPTVSYAVWPKKSALNRHCFNKSSDCHQKFRGTNALVDIYYRSIGKNLLIEVRSYDQKESSQISGLDATDPKKGNIDEITKAGSLHQFLIDLHKKFGPIASFWFGEHYVVSTSDAETFKPQKHAFDRPKFLFENLEAVLGEKSIQYLNGDRGKEVRARLDKSFTAQQCPEYMPTILGLANNLAKKWSREEKVPVHDAMLGLALKIIMRTSYGDYFQDDNICKELHKNYDDCFLALDEKLVDPTVELGETFHSALDAMKTVVRNVVQDRRHNPPAEGGRLLIDDIVDISDSEQQIFDLAITYIIGGFHTSGTTLAWLLYYLAKRDDVQEKVRNEIRHVMSGADQLTSDHVAQLIYTRDVIDETVRVTHLGPYAAREADRDLKICGYAVPKGTAIIQGLGVAAHNPKVWPSPAYFEPSRFEDVKPKYGDNLNCPSFGFAGKRKCPGYRFLYTEVFCVLSVLIPKFKFTLAHPDDQEMERKIGLVTHPAKEIWLNIEQIE